MIRRSSDKVKFEQTPEDVGLADIWGAVFLAGKRASPSAVRQEHPQYDQETVRLPRQLTAE